MFRSLRELDVQCLWQANLNSRLWSLECLHQNPMQHLRVLRINQPIAPDILPHLFFLPSLQTLEILVIDASAVGKWSLPHDFMPGRSIVAHLSITAMLTPSHLVQLLSWPAAIRSFTYIHEGYRVPCAQSPTPNTFCVALQRFRGSLKALRIHIPDWHFISADAIDDVAEASAEPYYPFLDTSHFDVLEELRVPSLLLFGLPSKEYSRNTLVSLLPHSLRDLEIVFGSQDDFYWYDPKSSDDGYNSKGRYAWLTALCSLCRQWGRFPDLQSVTVQYEELDRQGPPPDSIRWLYSLFARRGVTFSAQPIDPRYIRNRPDELPNGPLNQYEIEAYNAQGLYQREYWGRWWWSSEEDYEIRYAYREYGEIGAPVFGKALTEYSDSPRGTEYEEGYLSLMREEELLGDQEWERWDEMMEAERAKVGKRWEKGQWPPYEETREEREEVFRYCVL